MSGCRVYVGNLPSRASERDLEHFFRSFGRIRDVMLKSGFGFVEFDDPRDADDAVYDLNGREFMGHRVVVEISRRPISGRFGYGRRDGGGRDSYRDSREGVMTADGRINGRYPPPMKTRYRMIVTNLSSRCNWQEIKDLMRMEGKANVTYAEAHQRTRNEALLCFSNHDDLRRAMDKFQGKEINGRRIKIVDDTEGGGGSGRRRSRSRTLSRSRSRSPRSRSRSRSRSARRSRSRSPPSRSRSRSASSRGSKSASPAKNGGSVGEGGGKRRRRTPSGSRSRSLSARSSASRGKGGEAARDGSFSPEQNNVKEEEKNMED